MIHHIHIGRSHLFSVQLWPMQQLPVSEVLAQVDGPRLEELRRLQPQFFGADALTVELSLNVFVVRGQGRTLLVDTGEAMVRGGAVLAWGLSVIGIKPEEVDVVVLTHRDDDHVGGSVGLDGGPLFPRARYVMAGPEFEAFRSDTPRAARFRTWMGPIERRGVLDLV